MCSKDKSKGLLLDILIRIGYTKIQGIFIEKESPVRILSER